MESFQGTNAAIEVSAVAVSYADPICEQKRSHRQIQLRLSV